MPELALLAATAAPQEKLAYPLNIAHIAQTWGLPPLQRPPLAFRLCYSGLRWPSEYVTAASTGLPLPIQRSLLTVRLCCRSLRRPPVSATATSAGLSPPLQRAPLASPPSIQRPPQISSPCYSGLCWPTASATAASAGLPPLLQRSPLASRLCYSDLHWPLVSATAASNGLPSLLLRPRLGPRLCYSGLHWPSASTTAVPLASGSSFLCHQPRSGKTGSPTKCWTETMKTVCRRESESRWITHLWPTRGPAERTRLRTLITDDSNFRIVLIAGRLNPTAGDCQKKSVL